MIDSDPSASTPRDDATGDYAAEAIARRTGWMVWPARLALAIALVTTGYLASVALSGGPIAGCGPESGCNRVLSSRWAYWLGMPVSLPALGVYLTLLTATFFADVRRHPRTGPLAKRSIVLLSLLVLGGAAWFVFVQRVLLRDWCVFCLTAHLGGSAAAILLLGWSWRRRSGRADAPGLRRRDLGICAGVALAAVAVLVAGQIVVKPRRFAVTPMGAPGSSAAAVIALHQGRFRLTPGEVPTLGSLAAKHHVVCVFDYTCPHCRTLHGLFKDAEARFSGQLGIVSLPMPLDAACNPHIRFTAGPNRDACKYAKLSLAVWRAEPGRFREFDEWLFGPETVPPLDLVRARAEALVGREKLEQALLSPWVERQLQMNIALYEANGRLIRDARLPQLVIGQVVVHGAVDRLDALVRLIAQHTKLVPVETAGSPGGPR